MTNNTSCKSQAFVYSKHSSFQKEDGLHLISLIQLKEGMKVLDLGCGTGQLSGELADRVGDTGSVIGIDPDIARITLAKSTNESINNLIFSIGRAETIPGSDYDIVFSNYVFHWIKDKESVFRSIRRCLKPSGLFGLCFVTGLSQFVMEYIDLLEPAGKASEVKNKLFYSPANEIDEIALKCEYTIVHKSEAVRIVKFPHFDGFIDCVYGGFGGMVDTKYMDPDKLGMLKQRIGNGEVELELCFIVSYVFKLNGTC